MQKAFQKSTRKVVTPTMIVKNALGIGRLSFEVKAYSASKTQAA